jgi:hypothetical protein
VVALANRVTKLKRLITGKEFLDQLNNYQLLKDYATWS